MRVFITGGTGTVGSDVVRGLLDSGAEVRVLVRDAARAGVLPDGAEPASGDLNDATSLSGGMRGCDALFLLTPLSPNEVQMSLGAVRAAREAGIGKIVCLAVHRLEEAQHIPNFSSKLPAQEAIAESGLRYVFLQPNNFFQNDLMLKEAILRWGVYPQPLGAAGVSRVDVRDIADAAVTALTQDVPDGAYPLVGPDVLTGEETAEIWSRHLGTPVRYGGDDLDAWDQQVATMLPPWLVHDLRIMYDHFQKNGLQARPEEFDRQAVLLQHPSRRFEDFAAETAAAWKSESPAG